MHNTKQNETHVHAAVDVDKRHLGLNHPKLGQMARGVGVLGTKRWAKRVNVAQRARVRLALQLPRDSQVRGALEKVLGVVDLLVLGEGDAVGGEAALLDGQSLLTQGRELCLCRLRYA